MFGVGMQNPNDLVIGRFSIYINAQIRYVHYWLKLTRMNENRLPFKAYRMLCNLNERSNKLVSKVRRFLSSKCGMHGRTCKHIKANAY